MKRNFFVKKAYFLAVSILVGISLHGADGSWTSIDSGNWSDTNNWQNGIIAGDGGVATINLDGSGFTINNDTGTVSLSGITLNASVSEETVKMSGGTNEIIAPAVLNASDSSYLSFAGSTLSSSVDLYITGRGRLFLGTDNLLSGRTIISNGLVRAIDDTAFGPAPGVLDSDAIVLDGGVLMNDANNATLAISANRGITVTTNGGYLGCGYVNAQTRIDSPVTGPGFLGIIYQFSTVLLNNSDNDYTGGTRIGMNGLDADLNSSANLKLARDEVIPDAGGLIIGGLTALTNDVPGGTLDLNGMIESVDTLSSGVRAEITSSVSNQGRLIVGSGNDDSDYSGTLTGGATIEKQGTGAFDLSAATLASEGTIDLAAGTVQAGGPNLGTVTLLLNGGGLDIVAPDEPHELAAGEDNVLTARILLETNTILSVDSGAGNVVFAGIVTTNSVQDPEPVLTIDNGGVPLLFGSVDTAAPAVLDAEIASAGGIVLTNNVWLRRLPSASYTMSDDVNLFLDGDDLLGGGLVLSNYSATVLSTTTLPGDGSVTVQNGNAVAFSTLQFADHFLQDGLSGTFSVSNDVFLSGSGILFTGEGLIVYSGDFTGSGTIEKRGSGTTALTSTNSSLSGDIVIYDGTLEAGSEAVLGGADVTLAGGYLSNLDGGDLTLASTQLAAQDGGFNVTSNDIMTIQSQIIGTGPITKTGEGRLVLSGSTSNTGLDLTVSEGSLDLAGASGYAVDILSVDYDATATLAAGGGNQVGSTLDLNGGTFDLNGINETLESLNSYHYDSLVVNNGSAVVELTVGENDADSFFNGTLSDGSGALRLSKIGFGTMTVSMDSLAGSDGTDVDAGTLRVFSSILPVTTGLSYQLDAGNAGTVTLSGSKVTEWADSSIAGVDFTQGTSSQQPEYVRNAINGLPAVRFSDSERNRMVAGRSAEAQTVFIVAKTTSFGDMDGIWGVNRSDLGIRGSSLGVWQHPGGEDERNFTYNGDMYINGLAGKSYNPDKPYILTAVRSTLHADATHAIGDYWNDGFYQRYFRGYIGEVIVYDRELSAVEQEAVESYLSSKWFTLPHGISYRLDASDASTISLDGSSVTNWSDAEDSTIEFSQDDSVQQPEYVEDAVNGLPAVRFGESASTRMIANQSVAARTVFIVSQMIDHQSLAGVWGSAGQDKGIRHADNHSWRHTDNSGDENDFSFDGEMYINGVSGFDWGSQALHLMTAVGTSDKNWLTAIGNYWGGEDHGATRYLRGYIAEIIVYNRVLSIEERLYVERYLREKWLGHSFEPLSMIPVTVASNAVFAVNGNDLELGSLFGSGDFSVESGSVSVTNYSDFTGTASGYGILRLADPAGTDAVFTPSSENLTIRNDGPSPIDLLIEGAETNLFSCALQDGESVVGLVHSSSGVTYFSGTDSTYTGDTLINNGSAVVGGVILARYVRFQPLDMRDYGSYSDTGYQISEFHLLLDGTELDYPEGTSASATGVVPDGIEDPVNAVDDDVSTKFYVDGSSVPPLIVELPEPVRFDGYSWYTANDAIGRDPVEWTVEVSDDGISWIQVDYRDYNYDQSLVTESRKTLVGTWLFGDFGDMNIFSDMSATTVAAPAELTVSGGSETVGALSGDGDISLNGGTLGINAFTNATFSGDIYGSGAIVKTGAETQTLSAALSVTGEIIVEAGVLDLEGSVLTGITNIIIKSGAELTGSAAVNGDLTVTFDGGVYSGTLAVSGSLTTSGDVKLAIPEDAVYPVYQTLFTYASADSATQGALAAAVLTTTLPEGVTANVRVGDTQARLVAAPAGMLIMVR